MSAENQFKKTLDELWHRRRVDLLHELSLNGRGKPLELSRKIRDERIKRLQQLATKILIHGGAKKVLRKMTRFVYQNRINKKEARRPKLLVHWAQDMVSGPAVYSFWKQHRCLYVGQAKDFVMRLKSYKAQRCKWLVTGVNMKVYGIKSARRLAKAECLAINLFQPVENDHRAPNGKYDRKCKICAVHDKIKSELQSIFQLRRIASAH